MTTYTISPRSAALLSRMIQQARLIKPRYVTIYKQVDWRLLAFDGYSTMLEAVFPAQAEESGEFHLPFDTDIHPRGLQAFADVLKRLGTMATLHRGRGFSLQSANTRHDFPLASVDFLEDLAMEDTQGEALRFDHRWEALAAFAARDEARPILNAIAVADHGYYASDGYTGAFIGTVDGALVDILGNAPRDMPTTPIPAYAVHQIIRLAQGNPVQAFRHDRHFQFQTVLDDEVVLRLQVPQVVEKYPPLWDVLGAALKKRQGAEELFGACVTVDLGKQLKAESRAMSNPHAILIFDGTLQVLLQDLNNPGAMAYFATPATAYGFGAVALQPEYLQRALAFFGNLGHRQVQINLSGPKTPVLVYPAEDETPILAAIMPVHNLQVQQVCAAGSLAPLRDYLPTQRQAALEMTETAVAVEEAAAFAA